MEAQTITIIGLSRIGASLGLAVKQNLDMKVVGYDEIEMNARQAFQEMGAVDQLAADLKSAAAKADILVLTTPVSLLEESLRTIGDVIQSHTLILDLSKLKELGLKWARQYLQRGHYIGAVPILAANWLDDGRTTPQAATPDLFHNSLFAIMASAEVDPEAVNTAVNFGHVIGATPYFIDAAEYDRLIQGTDTLSALTAVALFKALHKSQSWQDMLRMSGTSFSLATQPLTQHEDINFMVLNDKVTTLHWLEALMNELSELRRIIYESEPEVVTAVIEQISSERDRWLLKRQDNEWEEHSGPDFDRPSMMGHLLGGFSLRQDKKDD